ncbi:MAG TPA: NADH-quinone oxidoreductase subunit N [Myxococcales bacterium]|nr:NADH-quinone oxidoreductase subunit N [Myxococcales bacterium]
MAETSMDWASLVPIVPMAAVALGALVILGVSMFFSGLPPESGRRLRRSTGLPATGRTSRRGEAGVEAELARMRVNLLLALVATVALAGAGAVAGTRLLTSPEPSARFPMLQLDALAAISILIVGLAAMLVIWLSTSRLTSIRIPYGEYYCLVLLGLAGSFVALQAENAMVLFLGLEVMGISASVLVAAERGKEHAIEAALKAFFANALASGMLLLGIAFLFGATGHFDYAGLKAALDPDQRLALAGLALLFAGFAMKLGLVPFHQWLPDVQEGASTSIAAYVSTCVVMTVILAWLRFILHALPDLGLLLAPVFSVLGVASIAIANLMALIQRNVKRMLGWLVIAQAGTWVLTFVVGGSVAYGALLFYLIAYALVMLGAFGVVMTLKGGGRELERLEHFAGIAQSRKGLAAIMTLFMLALAGVPGTVGFWARWHLVGALVGGGELALAVVAVLGSVISLYICMQVPVMMYMRETLEEEKSESSTNELVVLLLCAAVVIGLGIWPDPLISTRGVGLLELLQASVH